jgi:DNA-nicking Smr family endonuclease
MAKNRKHGSKPSIPSKTNQNQKSINSQSHHKSHRKQSKPDDDKALWQAFTQTIQELDLKGRVPDTERDLLDEMLRQAAAKANRALPQSAKPPKTPVTAKPGVAPKPTASKPVPKSAPQPSQIDARQVRRIGTGRDGIDARIDLHGMRQYEAHGALRAFLFRSVSKGHRMVLVITGKGHTSPNDDNHFGAFINEGALGRGVLRRNVPLWLTEPDLRSIVVGHTPAHIRHGGDGALYVQLRRRK